MFTSSPIVSLANLPGSYPVSPRRVKTMPEPLQTHTGCVLHVKTYIPCVEHHWVGTSQIPALFAVFFKIGIKRPPKNGQFSHLLVIQARKSLRLRSFFLKKKSLSLNLAICAFSGPTGRGGRGSFASVVGQKTVGLRWPCPYKKIRSRGGFSFPECEI